MEERSRSRRSLRVRRFLFAAVASGLALLGWMYAEARRDPVIRRVAAKLPNWPGNVRAVRVLLWSDIHIGNAATGPVRLARLVERANGLRPDLVVIAGDLVADEAEDAGGLSVLAGLRAPLGVVAVLGNHDHWAGAAAVRRALERAGVTVLSNGASRRGPVALGGLDDLWTGHDDLAATLAAMRALGGAPLIVSHSPDVASRLPGDVRLLVAGHTHCGQVVLPLYGPPVEVSAPRYRCGLVREGGRLTVVTAGTGTSMLPLRLGAPPDWWVLTLGP